MKFPEKLKKEIVDRLSTLIDETFDKSLFIDENILGEICQISGETGYEIALVVSRKGQILDVVCGDKNSAEIFIEENRGRLSGSRVIHTHPSGNPKLSNMDIALLKNKKLDCMCAVAIKEGKA